MTNLTEADASNELMRLARQIAKHDQLRNDENLPEAGAQANWLLEGV